MATKKAAAKKHEPATKSLKRDHGETTRERYVIAMERIISKKPGSTIRTVKDFSESINESNQYLGKVMNPEHKRHPNIHMLAEICMKHGINGDWLLTGRGDMFGGNEIRAELGSLATKLLSIEKELEKLKAEKKK